MTRRVKRSQAARGLVERRRGDRRVRGDVSASALHQLRVQRAAPQRPEALHQGLEHRRARGRSSAPRTPGPPSRASTARTSWPRPSSSAAAARAASRHAGSTSTSAGGTSQTRILSAPGRCRAASANGTGGGGGPAAARRARRRTARRARRRCRPTVRVSTPSTPKPANSASSAPSGTRKRVGLRPTRPQQEAGMRIEPPASLPWASATMPDGDRRAAAARRAARRHRRVPRVARGCRSAPARSPGACRTRGCWSCRRRSRPPRAGGRRRASRVGHPVAERAAAVVSAALR